MSRGLGRRQREVLSFIRDHGEVELTTRVSYGPAGNGRRYPALVPAGARRSEYQAIWRAVQTLWVRGLVDVSMFQYGIGMVIRPVSDDTPEIVHSVNGYGELS